MFEFILVDIILFAFFTDLKWLMFHNNIMKVSEISLRKHAYSDI